MNKLFKQFLHFIGFSGIGWVLDFTLYISLAFLGVHLFLCNVLGAVAGVTFVFIFSTRYIFVSHSCVPLSVKYLIYILYQIILVCSISHLLVLINGCILAHFSFEYVIRLSAIVSKILITPITMLLNFFVLKQIIEKI